MSNTTTTTTPAPGLTVDLARAVMIILAIGMIGPIPNIITFVQKQIRANSFSVDFVATAIIDFGIMNVFLLLEMLTRFDPWVGTLIYSTRTWCKLGYFILSLLPCFSSTYLVLVSIDRSINSAQVH
jgi:hypothetical protein